MALDSARQLLDELMGRTRDMDPQENLSGECDWTEPKVGTSCLIH